MNDILQFKDKARQVLILPVLIFVLFSCKSFLERSVNETNLSYDIRVKLRIGNEINVIYNRDIAVEDAITGDRILKNEFKKKIMFSFNDGKCMINGFLFQSPVLIYSKKQMLININGRDYFGTIKVIPDKNGIEVINTLPIETYLVSVVQSEMPLSFQDEALKTQAVIARTYSYYFMGKYGSSRNFDVDNTVGYQVYNGYNRKIKYEKIFRLMRVIKESRGLIIKYDNRPIIAYFHSNSGGKLSSGKEYFGSSSDLPYLQAKDDPYSTEMPGGKWNYTINYDDFKDTFDVSSDLSDDMFVKNDDGMIKSLKLGDMVFTAKELRRAIGYSKLKSERFRITFDNPENMILFEGLGFGHGVGLSQWGAENMARQGFKFDEIIKFYYPDTDLGYY